MKHSAVSVGLAFACIGVLLGLSLPAPGCAQTIDASDPFRFALQLYNDKMYLPAAEEFLSLAQSSSNRARADEARLWAARSTYGAGRYERTVSILEPLLSPTVEKSKACAAMLLSGKALEAMGNMRGALNAYATLVGRYPDCPQHSEAALRSGLITLDSGQPRRGLGFFSKVGDESPDSLRVAARLGRARALTILGEDEQAAAVLDDIGKSSRWANACEVRLEAGRIYGALGRLNDAATAYGRAAVHCADSLLQFQARVSLAEVLELDEDWEGAGRSYESAAGLAGENGGADELLRAGVAFGKAGRWDDVIRVLGSARSLMGKLPSGSLLILADAYRRKAQYSNAIRMFSLVELRTDDASLQAHARWEVGETYVTAEWYRLAANAFERCWLMRPDDPRSPEALWLVAEILAGPLERKAGAAEVYSRIASDYRHAPEAPEALLKAGEVWLELGRVREARAAYERIRKEYPTSPAAESAEEGIGQIDVYLPDDPKAAFARLESDSGETGVLEPFLTADVAFENLKDYERAASRYRSLGAGDREKDPEGRALFRLGESLRRSAENPFETESDADRRRAREQAADVLARVVAEYPDSRWAGEAEWVLGRMRLASYEGEEEGRILLAVDLLETFVAERARPGEPGGHSGGERTVEVFFDLGEAHRRLAEMGAGDHFRTAAEYYGEVPESDRVFGSLAGLWSAYCWLGAGEFIEAGARFARLAGDYRNRPLLPELLYHQAECLYGAQKTEEANRVLQHLVEQYPDSPWGVRAAVRLGQVLASSENPASWAAAARSFEQAAGRAAPSVLQEQAQLGWGEVLGKMGRKDEAVVLLDRLVSEAKGRPIADRARLAMGRILQRAGDFKGAENTYRAVIASAPSRDLESEVWAGLGEVLMAMGRDAEAAEAFESAHSGNLSGPLRLAVLKSLALARYRSDGGARGDSALVALRAANPPDTTVARVALERGRYLVRAGNTEEGLRMFAAVMENFPADDLGYTARYEVALRHLNAGEYEEARSLLRAIVGGNPGRDVLGKAWFKLGSTDYLMGRYRGAADGFEEVLRLQPEGPLVREAHFNLGLSLEKLGEWARAAEAYRTLLARFPEYEGRDRVAVKVGYALQEAGRYEEAIAAYEAARPGAAPEVGAEVQYWTAECNARARNLEKAIVAFLKVGYLFPEQTMWAATAELRAAELYVRTGKAGEARTVYRRVLERYGVESQWGAMANEQLETLGPLSE